MQQPLPSGSLAKSLCGSPPGPTSSFLTIKPIPKAPQTPFHPLAAYMGLISACAWDLPCTGAAGSPPYPKAPTNPA